MKKIICAAVILLASVSAAADEITLLQFKTADGKIQSITAIDTEIEIANGTLTATNRSETLSLQVTNLASMEFTQGTTAVKSLCDTKASAIEVVNIDGTPSGRFDSLQAAESTLAPGLYIVKTNSNATTKLLIRK